MGDEVGINQDEIDKLLGVDSSASTAATDAPPTPAPAPPPAPKPEVPTTAAAFGQLPEGVKNQNVSDISLISDIPIELSVELGKANKFIREVLDLGPGSVVELDRLVGEPVDLLANGRMIAKGEVVVVDEYFGIRLTAITEKGEET
jgi:flagellar motor switch protein FliN